jgi:PRC-barrel domain
VPQSQTLENDMATEARETSALIGSDKVEGTAVYSLDGTKIGTIERLMIDKISGKVAYAVMSFGGFMGIAEDYYPLPWSMLAYNETFDGYETGVSEEQLTGAPHYGKDQSWDWSSGGIDEYYKMPFGP